MPIHIGSWNCCLGLVNKVDIVQSILKDYKLDVLFIQEAEIRQNTPINLLNTNGYNLELSPTYGQQNSRSCCYIKSNLKYKRVKSKEKNSVEVIIIEAFNTHIIGIYRPFYTKSQFRNRIHEQLY